MEHILFFEKEPHLIKVFLLFLWAALKATCLNFSLCYYQTSSIPLIITKLILIHNRFIWIQKTKLFWKKYRLRESICQLTVLFIIPDGTANLLRLILLPSLLERILEPKFASNNNRSLWMFCAMVPMEADCTFSKSKYASRVKVMRNWWYIFVVSFFNFLIWCVKRTWVSLD